jgi:Leucine-rich repeat (LRR) protein
LSADGRVLAKFEAVSNATLSSLKKFPQIGGIDALDASQCTAKGFANLKELPNLQKLVLGKSFLTPEGVAAIGQCKELKHLGLVNAGLSDAELESLKKLTLLEHLTLSGNPKITDKGMQTVKEFDRLKVLYLGNTSISDEGLMELKKLDGLRTLNVSGTKVTQDAAEKFVDQMPNLRTVRR